MVDPSRRKYVWERAANCCEYCHLRQEHTPYHLFHVEHVIAKVHGGSDEVSNLALACDRCNFHKGTNLAGIDPETDKIIPLFNPRSQLWEEHFEMGISVQGKTAIGRATVQVLKMNADRRLLLRSRLIVNGEL
jgi:hypothetical protein